RSYKRTGCHRVLRVLERARMAFTADDAVAFAARRARIMTAIDGGVMVLAAASERVRSNDVHYPFRQDSDFHYVTGFPEPDAVCVLAPGLPEKYVLFVRPRDPERAIWVGPRAGVEGAVTTFGADVAFALDELEKELPRILMKADEIYLN